MKQILSLISAFILGISVTAVIGWKNNNNNSSVKHVANYNQQNSEGAQVIAIRRLKLKSGVSPESFEKFISEKFSTSYVFPGVREYIAKGERGDDAGNYIHVLIFDSKTTRDVYFPAAATNAEMPASIKSLIDASGKREQELGNMVSLVPTDSSYTDYVVLQ